MVAPGEWGMVGALFGLGLALSCGDDARLQADESGGPASASSDGGVRPATSDESAAASTGAGGGTTTASDTTAAAMGDSTAGFSDTSTGPAGSTTSTDGETGTTGTAVVHEPVVLFTDVAAAAGVDELHGTFQSPPNCIIDQLGPGVGGYCISERMAGASAVGDFDNDGRPDLFFARTYGMDRLYRNAGDGTFQDVALDVGIVSGTGSSGSVFADFDNDGDQDLYVTRMGQLRYALYINEGGVFTEEAIARGASLKSNIQHSPTGITVGDYDLDGYLDLYVGEWKTNLGISKEASHSRLLHNRGAAAPGHFEDVTDAAGVNIDQVWAQVGALAGTYAFSPSLTDLDGDGYPDLTIVSDFRCTRLFWNNGDGTFTDGTVASGVGIDRNGMGSTMGDFDGDGDIDWFVTAITQPTGMPENRLFRNAGNRQFTDLANALGVGSGGWGWGTTFLDVDNDADLDLMMTAGYYYTSYLQDKNQLWLGEGGGLLSADVAPQVGLSSDSDAQGRGVNAFDYDGDGDLDLFLVNNNDLPNLFRNDTQDAGDWLTVRAVGTTSNRDGIGAKVTVIVAADQPWQYREIGSMAHYVGAGGRQAHFGLGWSDTPDSDPVAEVRVFFPASGVEHVLTDVPRNQALVVTE